MKNKLSSSILALILVVVLGGCSVVSFEPSAMDVPTLPPTQLPEIIPPQAVVYNPMVTISPTNGQAGTLVQVLASGFLPDVPVSVAFGPVNSEFGVVAQGKTDLNGSFTAHIPVQGAAGMDLIIAVGQDGQPAVLSPDYFHIMEAGQPVVAIAPTSGVSGTLVQVVASGFTPNSPVSVGMGPVNAGIGPVAQGYTNENGVFIVSVPAQGSLGMMLVFAVAVDGQPGVLSSEQFQVTGAVPNPAPSTDTSTVLPTPTPYQDLWVDYLNPVFDVSLQYPADWQPEPGYGSPEMGEIRYAGINGFFHISAMDTESIDMAVAAEAYHKLQPYGSQPVIESLQIQGQEARLILPSSDQPAGMHYQAGLIVRYPQPVNISGTPCRFFILWADQAHIRALAETIRFIN